MDRAVSIIEFQVRRIMGKRIIAIACRWHYICIILPSRVRTAPAARPQKRADLWWSDNIPDFQRLFPAPSSTRVTSIRLTRRWISRAKDVGLKVPFEPGRE